MYLCTLPCTPFVVPLMISPAQGLPFHLLATHPQREVFLWGARPSERALGNLHGDASEVTGPMLQDLDLCRTEPISGIQPPLGAVWPSPGRKSVDHDLA
jgi:hypothetical protein